MFKSLCCVAALLLAAPSRKGRRCAAHRNRDALDRGRHVGRPLCAHGRPAGRHRRAAGQRARRLADRDGHQGRPLQAGAVDARQPGRRRAGRQRAGGSLRCGRRRGLRTRDRPLLALRAGRMERAAGGLHPAGRRGRGRDRSRHLASRAARKATPTWSAWHGRAAPIRSTTARFAAGWNASAPMRCRASTTTPAPGCAGLPSRHRSIRRRRCSSRPSCSGNARCGTVTEVDAWSASPSTAPAPADLIAAGRLRRRA